jgi:Asp-tRNA(Asn)/Glu-tRNA(Gln) amidotransferase A subunit family amidase
MAHRKRWEVLMGIFEKLFQTKKSYPTLDQSSPYARYLEGMQEPLEKLVGETSDPIEIIPSEKQAFAFIGKPPKRFGVAWVEEDGEIVNFKRLLEEKGLPAEQLEKLSHRLREIYISHKSEPRYAATIHDREVVVTPSDPMLIEVKEVIDKTVG